MSLLTGFGMRWSLEYWKSAKILNRTSFWKFIFKIRKKLSLVITFFTDFSIGWRFWKMVKMWYKFQVYEFVIYTIFLSLKSFKLIWLNSCMSKFTCRFQYELESEIVLNTEQPSTFSIIIFFQKLGNFYSLFKNLKNKNFFGYKSLPIVNTLHIFLFWRMIYLRYVFFQTITIRFQYEWSPKYWKSVEYWAELRSSRL